MVRVTPSHPLSPRVAHDAIRAVAVFEAAKGVIVLLGGLGLLTFLHHDARHFAEELVEFFHLNPAGRYPGLFIRAMEHLEQTRLVTLALAGLGYVMLRFVEAYGLWRERKWAEWLAAASGAIYMPLEIRHMGPGHMLYAGIALALNLLIVGLMLYSLWSRRMREAVASVG